MRVATLLSISRLISCLYYKLMKYAASNWTLVNQGWGCRHKRHSYERSCIIHVNNIHLEYANTAYNTQYKLILKSLSTFKSGDKRAMGHCEKLMSMHTVSP